MHPGLRMGVLDQKLKNGSALSYFCCWASPS